MMIIVESIRQKQRLTMELFHPISNPAVQPLARSTPVYKPIFSMKNPIKNWLNLFVGIILETFEQQ